MMAGRVRLETLVSLRWIAIAGQLAALFVVRYGLGFSFPLFWALAAVSLSAAVNGYLMWRHPGGRQLADREAVLELAFDLLQLSFLLYLTGGLANPFALLILAPVTVSASVLSRRSTLALLTLGLLLISLLALWHRPLPWEGTALAIPRLYLFAVWAGLALAMTFLALYVARVSAEARQRAQALAATEAALDRAQKLSDLGALAAAAAHELGTPLGTITLAVRELLEELPADDPRGEDLRLISDQAERCRDILQQLSMRSEQPSGHPFDVQPLSALAREAARPFERLTDVAIEVHDRATDPAAGPQPQTRRRPEILHALTSFIENAVGFARGRVEIDICWDTSDAWCRIRDDGPGFDTAVLRHLGAPYLGADPRGSPSSARESAAGLGLGVFIAKTLLERTGARVEFGNAAEGGAVVSIRWPRSALEDGDKNTEDAS
ncbi:MAG: sensor histidine kinase [Alphaproteobacteria bacterium]|nr:MAG: sensor histidine kinase [Alphaproteobacteria bacterium]